MGAGCCEMVRQSCERLRALLWFTSGGSMCFCMLACSMGARACNRGSSLNESIPQRPTLTTCGLLHNTPAQVHVYGADVSLPALTEEGKVVMEGASRPAHSPRASGDVWAAMRESGALAALYRSGATCVEVGACVCQLCAWLCSG